MYWRAEPLRALKTNKRLFNSMRYLTGSWCRDVKMGLMFSLFFVPLISLAAAADVSEHTDKHQSKASSSHEK